MMKSTRRSFLTQTALLPFSVESFSASFPLAAQGYAVKIMATNWGFSGSLAAFCQKVKEAGYDGIEMWLPRQPSDRASVVETVQRHQLALGLLCGSGATDPREHFSQFSKAVSDAVQLNPLYINCHSGKDFHRFADNKACLEWTSSISKQSGIPILHETHRGRALFAAHVTRDFLEAIPSLRLTFDVSHWCNVHESLLADQSDTLRLVLPRVDHIHARVGHPEGPQVNDPRAPEWAKAVEAHLSWWDQIATTKKQEGKLLTILTEFGPPDYLSTLPYTRQPVADQWDINKYMMQWLRKRYL